MDANAHGPEYWEGYSDRSADVVRYDYLAADLARRLTLKGDAAYVLEAYRQAGIPVPPLVAREGTGED